MSVQLRLPGFASDILFSPYTESFLRSLRFSKCMHLVWVSNKYTSPLSSSISGCANRNHALTKAPTKKSRQQYQDGAHVRSLALGQSGVPKGRFEDSKVLGLGPLVPRLHPPKSPQDISSKSRKHPDKMLLRGRAWKRFSDSSNKTDATD